MITIRPATKADADRIWEILREAIRPGDTYAFSPESTKEEMLEYWMGKDRRAYVAEVGLEIAGTFVIKPNQPGLGSHIANAGYVTGMEFRGRGVGKAMGEFSLVEAKHLGYLGMQFNIVVKSNTKAVDLWRRIGFEIIGEIPDAFRHKILGLTNAYVMYKRL